MMRRVLIVWEFGAGQGHVMLQAGVTHFIRAARSDVELVFALRDPAAGHSAGLPAESVLQSPRIQTKPGHQPLLKLGTRVTFGEMICEALIGESQDSDRYLAEWNALIAALKPDVIVADYSPIVNMLVRGKIPVVACGNGYSLPPANVPVFPPMSSVAYPSFGTEPELLERLNAVLARADARPLDRLPQMNEAPAYGLATLPLFDPYAGVPGRDWLGIHASGGLPHMSGSHAGGFAYFNERHQVEDNLIDGLVQSGIAIDAYMGPPLRRTRKRVRGTAVNYAEERFELAKVLPGKAIAIHSGSLGLCAAAAFAGVSQVMLPKHQENYVNARGLVACGAGMKVQPSQRTPGKLADTIRAAAENETMRAAARALAVSLDPWRSSNSARTIAERTLALMS